MYDVAIIGGGIGGLARIRSAIISVVAIHGRVRAATDRIASVIRTAVAVIAADRRVHAASCWIASVGRAGIAVVATNGGVLAGAGVACVGSACIVVVAVAVDIARWRRQIRNRQLGSSGCAGFG